MLFQYSIGTVLIFMFSNVSPANCLAKNAVALGGRCADNLLSNITLVPNTAFTASSIHQEELQSFQPYQARMTKPYERHESGLAWCVNWPNSGEQWIQIEFPNIYQITSLITVGRGQGNFEEYVEQIQIKYQREDNGPWITYSNFEKDNVLHANKDNRIPKHIKLDHVIIGRRFRILVWSKNRRPCLRVSLQGCSYSYGLLSYSSPATWKENDKLNLDDESYDGTSNPMSNSQGVGKLVDGQACVSENSTEVFSSDKNLSPFVGWKRKPHTPDDHISLDFKFNTVRNFSSVTLFSYEATNLRVGFPERLSLEYSRDGHTYHGGNVLSLSWNSEHKFSFDILDNQDISTFLSTDSKANAYRTSLNFQQSVVIIRMNFKELFAKFIRLNLYFHSKSDFLILSEVSFNSTIPKEIPPIPFEIVASSTTTQPPIEPRQKAKTSSPLSNDKTESETESDYIKDSNNIKNPGNFNFHYTDTATQTIITIAVMLSLVFFVCLILGVYFHCRARKNSYRSPRSSNGSTNGDSSMHRLKLQNASAEHQCQTNNGVISNGYFINPIGGFQTLGPEKYPMLGSPAMFGITRQTEPLPSPPQYVPIQGPPSPYLLAASNFMTMANAGAQQNFIQSQLLTNAALDLYSTMPYLASADPNVIQNILPNGLIGKTAPFLSSPFVPVSTSVNGMLSQNTRPKSDGGSGSYEEEQEMMLLNSSEHKVGMQTSLNTYVNSQSPNQHSGSQSGSSGIAVSSNGANRRPTLGDESSEDGNNSQALLLGHKNRLKGSFKAQSLVNSNSSGNSKGSINNPALMNVPVEVGLQHPQMDQDNICITSNDALLLHSLQQHQQTMLQQLIRLQHQSISSQDCQDYAIASGCISPITENPTGFLPKISPHEQMFLQQYLSFQQSQNNGKAYPGMEVPPPPSVPPPPVPQKPVISTITSRVESSQSGGQSVYSVCI